MTEKLKPCPFCLGKAVLGSNDKGHWAGCVNSECFVQTRAFYTEEEAVKAWNTRAADENPPLTIEELREMNGESVLTITDTDAIDILQRKLIGGRLATVKLQRYLYLDVHEDVVDYGDGTCRILDWKYGKTWLAYKRKPEVQND